MCELSIIVPVYNTGITSLDRVMQALLTQEVSDYEVILVDDGSRDGSGEYCDMLAEKFNNVRVLHGANGGPGKARNCGIAAAEGRYIAFCDGDDVPCNNLYGMLLDIMKHEDVEMAMCDIYSERNSARLGFPWDGNQIFKGEEIITQVMASMLGNPTDDDVQAPVWGSSVRSVYDKSIIDKYDIRFPEDIRFAEDLVFNIRYLLHCKSCYVLNEDLYRYTFNRDSLMNSHVRYKPTMFAELLKLKEYIEDDIEGVDTNGGLLQRFRTSCRCYFHDAVGNAARSAARQGYRYALGEIRRITNHQDVKNVFEGISVRNPRKYVLYNLIRLRCNALLLTYYVVRLRNKAR